MDARFVNPFISALGSILPQLGFSNIVRNKLFTKEQFIDGLGVTVNVPLSNQLQGNVVFNMSEDAAKGLSSIMMMGQPIAVLDDMARSALCEMVNMIASNAATSLNKDGFAIRLAPPAFHHCSSQYKICNSKYIGIEMSIDDLVVEVGIGIDS